jgi:uncharacterized protein DUF3106
MIRATVLSVSISLALAGAASAQSADERQWLTEHPEALQALGSMPKEDLGKFLQTYQGLSADEKAKLREHAGEMQQMTPEERKWALDNPDAVRELGSMPEDQQKKILESYRSLSPEEKQKLREHADELRNLSPEDKNWALEHPDAVRQLGSMPDAQRKQMMDAYRSLPPETQDMLRDRMGGAGR